MLEIRRLGPDVWRLYRDIRMAALTDAPHAFASRVEFERTRSASEWRARLAQRTQFVASDDGKPVGMVGCRPQGGSETGLVSMWVTPEARGTGVADRLVAAAIEEAGANGSVAVVLWVSEGNERAERLYTRHGFAPTGRVQPIDDDDPARGSEFQMRRSLVDGPP